ncbi:class I SAM-dependent RNA methyltransferase [Chryseolinea sp. T2]|uniref:THUMP domain-containing class I SAM-dependent RNA methyltransferase n=1 Tax=Chryseolinea sp. T2 TaxID=3129255 RepID=UPI00309D95F9
MILTPFITRSKVVVTCSKRLAPFLESEIRNLGFIPESVFPTGVIVRATMNECIRLNLNLRCASQVHYSLESFRANHPDDVYRHVVDMPWEKLLGPDDYFSITSNVDHPTINNSMFANVRVKDAVVDRMVRVNGRRPNSGSELSGAVIYLFWKGEHAEIFIDTSGDSLAKHGYRMIPGKAPMLEGLASATLLASRWDKVSPFVNPMCGSGTVAIEAVLLATNRVPGLYRENYSFMHFSGYEKKIYDDALRTIRRQVVDVPGLQVIASDISRDAIDIAQKNASFAGVEKLINFRLCDFAETPVPETPGVIYFNPEYGERLGAESQLEETYARMGDFLKKKCQGYLGYVFTGNLDLAKKIGLRASSRIEFYSARIDCRLLEYELYAGSRQ